MVEMTDKMREEISKQGVFALATSSASGVPNVVPVGMLFVEDNSTICVVDNYMCKTLANVKENPWAALYVWNPELKTPWQIKGKVSVETSGADYEKARAMAKSKRETFPAKSLIKISITEIYSVAPGPEAGKKIA